MANLANSSTTIPTTRTLLDALRARLAALTWNGEPAFASINLYDLRDIAAALRELVVSQDRICLVVYEGETFATQRQGRNLHIKQVVKVTLFMSDQNLGDRQAAFYGADGTPGVIALKDLIVGLAPLSNGTVQPAVLGLLLPNSVVTPVGSEPFVLSDSTREELAGRGAWATQLEITSGMLSVDTGLAPVV